MSELDKTYPYIGQCERIVNEIDVSALEQMELQGVVGSSDHLSSANTLTYALGETTVSGNNVALAVKIDPGNTFRLQGELEVISSIIALAPELAPKFPLFMGGLALKGRDIRRAAILTEDATKGGLLPIRPAFLSHDTLAALDKSVSDEGGLYAVFDRETLVRSTSFDVGGEERILDLHPSPFNFEYQSKHRDEHRKSFPIFREAASELTFRINPESPLGESLSVVL